MKELHSLNIETNLSKACSMHNRSASETCIIPQLLHIIMLLSDLFPFQIASMGDSLEIQVKKLEIKQSNESERLGKMEQTLAQMREALTLLTKSENLANTRPPDQRIMSIRTEMPKFDGENICAWMDL